MSMSTRIEDLPDHLPDHLPDNLPDQITRQDEQVMYNTMQNRNVPDSLQDSPVDSNIKMNVKKRVTFQEEEEEHFDKLEEKVDLISYLQSQVNEENVLLFIALVLASRNYIDMYINKYFLVTSDLFTVGIRCGVILLIYILVKYYLLSKLRL